MTVYLIERLNILIRISIFMIDQLDGALITRLQLVLQFIYRLINSLLRIREVAKVNDHDGQNFVLIVADIISKLRVGMHDEVLMSCLTLEAYLIAYLFT